MVGVDNQTRLSAGDQPGGKRSLIIKIKTQ